jgi:cytochrome c553
MMKLLSIALLLALAQTAHAAGDVVAGEKKATEKACLSCHGKDYKTPIDPSYPILAGQHEDYLYNALKQYQRGAKGDKSQALARNNAIMGGQASGLSPKEMRDIAAYLASLPGPLSVHNRGRGI